MIKGAKWFLLAILDHKPGLAKMFRVIAEEHEIMVLELSCNTLPVMRRSPLIHAISAKENGQCEDGKL